MNTTKAQKWAAIIEKIKAAKFAHVHFNCQGQLCWAGQEIPQKFLSEMPSDLVLQARAAADARHKAQEVKSRELAAKYKAENDALMARKHEAGFVLLAGEDTEVVKRGTLDECMCACSLLPGRIRRDRQSGIGCYVILSPEGKEVISGKFNRYCYY